MRRRIDKKSELLILVLSLSLGATVFFFSPFELLVNNQGEFFVRPGKIVFALFVATVIVIAGAVALLNVILIISKPVFQIVTALLFGFLLSGYIQMLFFNGRMKFLNAEEPVVTSDVSLFDIVNILIFVIVLLTPVVLAIMNLREEKRKKESSKLLSSTILIVSGAIFLMQLAGASSSALTHTWKTEDSGYPTELSYFSYKGTTSLSREENIIVFLVDRFAGKWMDATLEAYPETKDILQGFTYYRDCVSCYPCTFPSVPQMVTGCEYEKQTWVDYLTKAWNEDNLLGKLKSNGYSVNLALDSSTTYVSMRDVAMYADNVVVPSAEDVYGENKLYRINYTGKGGILSIFLKYSMAKLVPQGFKDYFLLSVGASPTDRFVLIDDSVIDRQPPVVSNNSDLAFADYLDNFGLNADNAKKTYVFIHLNGVHNPKQFLADFAPDKGAAAPDLSTATARGVLAILDNYFCKLRELGIYDKSTIIVLADHGSQGLDLDKLKSENPPKGMVSGYISTMLIKPKDAPLEPLIVDNTAQVSNQYIPATILESAGIEHSNYGISIQDVLREKLTPERTLRLVMFEGFFAPTAPSEPGIFRINGSTFDDGNWVFEER